MNINIFANKIKPYVDNEVCKFAIYPFGRNGYETKNFLKEYYGIEPMYLIDNNHCGYNGILSYEEYVQKEDAKNTYIILTIQNEEANKAIFDQLKNDIGEEWIINLFPDKKIIDNRPNDLLYRPEKFRLTNILGIKEEERTSIEYRHNSNGKIKVRVEYSTTPMWNSVSTLCEACENDDSIDLLIVVANTRLHKEGEMEAIVKNTKYSWIKAEEYYVEEDKPDIFVLSNPYNRVNFGELKKCGALVVVNLWTIIKNTTTNKEFFELLNRNIGKYNPDYYLIDSFLYDEIKDTPWFEQTKYIEMGNPKFDGIYEACSERKYPLGWEKLNNGKPTVLWATDHGFLNTEYGMIVGEGTTFDLYASFLFSFFRENKNINLVFRPHPSFLREMIFENHYWAEKDLQTLRDYCVASPNVIFDETTTYDGAYSVSDAIMIDARCGMVCSALPTKKPICVLQRKKDTKAFEKKLVDNYYIAANEEQLDSFLQMVIRREDPKLPLREKICATAIRHFDGKNGLRMKEFIIEKYKERERKAY